MTYTESLIRSYTKQLKEIQKQADKKAKELQKLSKQASDLSIKIMRAYYRLK